MAKKFNNLKKDMSYSRKKKIDAKIEQALEEMTLSELRQNMAVSQESLADVLDTKQSSISKIEHRGDMLLSTLYEYIEGLGGELEIRANFSGISVKIDQSGYLNNQSTQN